MITNINQMSEKEREEYLKAMHKLPQHKRKGLHCSSCGSFEYKLLQINNKPYGNVCNGCGKLLQAGWGRICVSTENMRGV